MLLFSAPLSGQNSNESNKVDIKKSKTVSTSTTFKTRKRLPEAISESSGLIMWNGLLWTHNDNNGTNSFFSFDSENPGIYEEFYLDEITTRDWEAISQDEKYFYIGDFGNNYGDRTDLKIVRINKEAFLNKVLEADTINFSFSTQTDFTKLNIYKTDYDCEAFIVTSDSIYLFTKSWVSKTTSIYSLPKTPGTYSANYLTTYNLGLVTDAMYLENKRMLILCGYSRNFLRQFLYVFCDSEPGRFFQGNRYNITMNLGLFPHQVEGIASTDGKTFYVTNEHRFISPRRVHTFELPDKIFRECEATFPDSTLVNKAATDNTSDNSNQVYDNNNSIQSNPGLKENEILVVPVIEHPYLYNKK